jgi:ribonuclease P protein component
MTMTDGPSHKLSKSQKLRRPAEFRRVYDGKIRAGDEHLLVFATRNETGITRIGLSVSKKNGGAVARNRIKRLLREAFRLDQYAFPAGLDLVLIPRPGSGAGLADFRRSLANCVRRVMKRLPASIEMKVETPSEP